MSEARLYGVMFTVTIPDQITDEMAKKILVKEVESLAPGMKGSGVELVQTQVRLIPFIAQQNKKAELDGDPEARRQ